MNDNRVEVLMELGLSELEASIYTVLLGNPGLTGYGIAKKLGKAVPNVYRGVSSLKGKGGILGDSTSPTEVYSVILLKEFTNRLKSQLARKIDAAETAFKGSEIVSPRNGLYTINQAGQVMEKAIAIAGAAEKSISVFADKNLLAQLAPFFTAASNRGVRVIIRCYEKTEVEGCDLFLWERRPERDQWSGQILCITADGSQALVSFVGLGDRQNSVKGFWIRNPLLALLLHQGMASGIIHGRLISGIKDGFSAETLLEEMKTLTQKHVYSIPHHPLHNDLDREKIE